MNVKCTLKFNALHKHISLLEGLALHVTWFLHEIRRSKSHSDKHTTIDMTPILPLPKKAKPQVNEVLSQLKRTVPSASSLIESLMTLAPSPWEGVGVLPHCYWHGSGTLSRASWAQHSQPFSLSGTGPMAWCKIISEEEHIYSYAVHFKSLACPVN